MSTGIGSVVFEAEDDEWNTFKEMSNMEQGLWEWDEEDYQGPFDQGYADHYKVPRND